MSPSEALACFEAELALRPAGLCGPSEEELPIHVYVSIYMSIYMAIYGYIATVVACVGASRVAATRTVVAFGRPRSVGGCAAQRGLAPGLPALHRGVKHSWPPLLVTLRPVGRMARVARTHHIQTRLP